MVMMISTNNTSSSSASSPSSKSSSSSRVAFWKISLSLLVLFTNKKESHAEKEESAFKRERKRKSSVFVSAAAEKCVSRFESVCYYMMRVYKESSLVFREERFTTVFLRVTRFFSRGVFSHEFLSLSLFFRPILFRVSTFFFTCFSLSFLSTNKKKRTNCCLSQNNKPTTTTTTTTKRERERETTTPFIVRIAKKEKRRDEDEVFRESLSFDDDASSNSFCFRAYTKR